MTPDTTYNHDRTVAAFFDTRAAAEKARVDVMQAGVPSDMVSIVEGRQNTASTAATQTQGQGFWESVKDLFAPDEDKHAYAEGLSRGGYLLTAHMSEAHYDQVLEILDREGAVDMDERETQWKSEGWSGYQATTPVAPVSAVGSNLDRPVPARGQTTEDNLGAETIQLAEESLQVGKRDINHGRVRLRSYVVEKPVHETINLRSEQVNVSRRPIDRAIGADEALFQERTISAEEHSEEAVVSKQARVVEEVSLNKTAQDRVHEVNETVRKTQVEVDDGRGAGQRAAGAGGAVAMGTRAYDSGDAIAEHMEVIASDGTVIGTVDHMDGNNLIKLAKHDSPDGMHHTIPTAWIDHVDTHVHLTKTASAVRSEWTAV